MEVRLIRIPTGFAIHPEDAGLVKRIKHGAECIADVRQPRNYAFHKKYFALVSILFQIWCETEHRAEYKGEKVTPSLDRFRRDLTILAGHYEPVFNIRGETRLEPHSISFANMSADEFEVLYQTTIDVGLQKIIPAGRYTEEELKAQVEKVMGFT